MKLKCQLYIFHSKEYVDYPQSKEDHYKTKDVLH